MCRNTGNITGVTAFGLGYTCNVIMNCCNFGKIESKAGHCGGITISRGRKVYNCLNIGKLTADKVGVANGGFYGVARHRKRKYY